MLSMFVLYGSLAILALMAFVESRPAAFTVARTTTITAPPETIFPLINDLRAMNSWNPFDAGVPEAARSYGGPASGPGATYAWDVKGRAGAGNIAITHSVPASKVCMQLTMLRPFAGQNQVTFTLQPAGQDTHVTWAMSGRNTFMSKLMGLIMNMDKMVGGMFETGLADLKAKAERS
jgi:uncharacterized protein YndB with AHSA1/START domain